MILDSLRAGFQLRSTWVGLALYAAAFALRLSAWTSPIYGDEAWHFYAGRHLLDPPTNIVGFLSNEPLEFGHLFLWRPLFEGLLAPAALVSFPAWRFAHLALTSLTPVLAWSTLRRLGVRPTYAVAAGLSVLALPVFLTWGVVVFPDGLLTVFVAAALWARAGGRRWLSALFLLAAVWTKESGVLVAGFLAAYDLVASLRDGSTGVRPLRVGHSWSLEAAAAVVGLMPLVAYVVAGGQSPGWRHEDLGWTPLDPLFVFLPFVAFVFAGVVWSRTRWVAGLALVHGAFYLTITKVLDRMIEPWYYVLPAYLSIIASAAVLDEASLVAVRRPGVTLRRGVGVVACAAALLIAAQVVLPSATANKGALTHPLTRVSDRGLFEEIGWMNVRGHEEEDLFRVLSVRNDAAIALIDVAWFFALYPFGERHDVVRQAYTEGFPGDHQAFEDWAHLVESKANLTVVRKEGHRLDRALEATYSSCRIYENSWYFVFEGPRCAGRVGALEERYARQPV